MVAKSFFPILYRLSDSWHIYIARTPEELPSGKAFTVEETNVEDEGDFEVYKV